MGCGSSSVDEVLPDNFSARLRWRRAVQNFKRGAIVDDTRVNQVLKAALCTPTSFDMRPFHIIVVTNQEQKDQLKRVSWHQKQVSDCSHLLIFCARRDYPEKVTEYVQKGLAADDYIRNIKAVAASTAAGVSPPISEDAFSPLALEWASQQTYRALGFALSACTELQLPSCPLGR